MQKKAKQPLNPRPGSPSRIRETRTTGPYSNYVCMPCLVHVHLVSTSFYFHILWTTPTAHISQAGHSPSKLGTPFKK